MADNWYEKILDKDGKYQKEVYYDKLYDEIVHYYHHYYERHKSLEVKDIEVKYRKYVYFFNLVANGYSHSKWSKFDRLFKRVLSGSGHSASFYFAWNICGFILEKGLYSKSINILMSDTTPAEHDVFNMMNYMIVAGKYSQRPNCLKDAARILKIALGKHRDIFYVEVYYHLHAIVHESVNLDEANLGGFSNTDTGSDDLVKFRISVGDLMRKIKIHRPVDSILHIVYCILVFAQCRYINTIEDGASLDIILAPNNKPLTNH